MSKRKHKNTVLIVDDDAKIVAIFTKLLNDSGCQVQKAANAAEVFVETDRLLPDLILLDILLPGLDGFEIAARLKEKKRTKDIPIIFLTVKNKVEDKIKGFKLGAVDYLTKPINIEEAAARINTHLALHNLQKSLEEKNRALIHDITERKRAEEALKQSEIAYKELADSITDVFFAMDKKLKYTYWNKASEILTGIPAEKAIGKSLYELFPAVKGTKTEKIYLEVLKTKQSRSFVNEFKLKNKDYFFEINAYPIKDGISVFTKDITDHKLAERELSETHQLLETILASTHMLVAYLDPQFNFVWVNRAYAEADNREPSFFPGKNHFELYPYPENEEIFQNVVHTGKPYFSYARAFEYEEHPERGVSYWDWSLIPIKNPRGVVTGLVLTLVDITKRVQAEEQLEASLREKEVLLKEVHHRVKNNLQVINSLLSLQSRRLDDKNIISVFEEVKNRIFSIALVHEKLYESKNLAAIDFGEYIRILTAHLRKTFPTDPSAVKLNIKTKETSLQVDKAIPCALIINELVTNALKYAFPGNKKGEITVAFRTGRNGKMVLTVADNGVGLPADFDMDAPKALGMQIIKALVKQLHGSLRVGKDKGAKFTIEFREKPGNTPSY